MNELWSDSCYLLLRQLLSRYIEQVLCSQLLCVIDIMSHRCAWIWTLDWS